MNNYNDFKEKLTGFMNPNTVIGATSTSVPLKREWPLGLESFLNRSKQSHRRPITFYVFWALLNIYFALTAYIIYCHIENAFVHH